MPRGAFILSIALHAGLLAVIGWFHPSTTVQAGPGDFGVGLSFLSEESGGLLVAESTTPLAAPEPQPEPATDAQSVAPPAPSVSVTAPLSSELVSPAAEAEIAAAASNAETSPAPLPAPSKPERMTRRASSQSGTNVAMKSGGTSSGLAGGSSIGSGSGGGGRGFTPPRFLLRYKPPYPEAARAKRLEGTVLLLVSVDASGRVTTVNLVGSSGFTVLDRTALDAVRSWRFDPARQNGAPIAAQVEVPVRFRFEERRS